jgi:hypothetical protein
MSDLERLVVSLKSFVDDNPNLDEEQLA